MNEEMKTIDLFCGAGGWAKGFIAQGFDVSGYDILDFSSQYPGSFNQVDLFKFNNFPHADVAVASPECTDFSKASFPASWKCVQKYGYNLDNAIRMVERTKEIIAMINPRYWVVENVRGSVKYINKIFGEVKVHYGSRYLWGKFPLINIQANDLYGKTKIGEKRERHTVRSIIPYSISSNIARAIKEDMDNKESELNE